MDRIPLHPDFDDGTIFRSVFAASPDALLLVDLKGTIVIANPAALVLLGYSGDELIGLPVDKLVPDAVRPHHAAYREAYATDPRPRPMGLHSNLAARRRDGSEVTVEIALSPLQQVGLPYVLAAIRDIGAYPRVQQALRRARYAEQLALFGRLAVDARDPHAMLPLVPTLIAETLQVETAMVLLLEPDGLSNRLVAGIGLPDSEAVGQLLAGGAHDLPPGTIVAGGEPLILGDPAHRGQRELPERWRLAGLACGLVAPLADRGETVGYLAAAARTERRFDEDDQRFMDSLSSMLATVLQREKSEQALNHAQRLESVGQLTGGIAHDFNNLLTVISGNLQVLEDMPSCASDPAVRQLVQAAERATRRGAELTSKLLAFSRRQMLQPETVDIRALLESLSGMLRRTLEKHIAIEVRAAPAYCRADPVQLESALLNLAINARDAMPEGGTLCFSCGPATELPAELQDIERAAADYVAIAVSDTGTGMPETVRRHVFEPFFTTKEAGRGTGLGLATVYGFARQSHGAIGLRSAPGEGTTLTLYLPREQPEAGAGTAAGAVPDRPIKGLRVLVVEDDAEVRHVVRNFLAVMGCEALSCADAGQALDLLAAGAEVDLLLTDMVLGAGMRGTRLARQARQLRPGLPILVMSGFSAELSAEAAVADMLSKPFTQNELATAIARAIYR